MTTTTGKMITNHLGFKQYVDVLDENCCPNCEMQYTNEGDGVLCKDCELAEPPLQSELDVV
jgi:hypothetical protein